MAKHDSSALMAHMRATEAFVRMIENSRLLGTTMQEMAKSASAMHVVEQIAQQTRRLEQLSAPNLKAIEVASSVTRVSQQFQEIQNASQRQLDALAKATTPKLPGYASTLAESAKVLAAFEQSLSISSRLADQMAGLKIGGLVPSDWAAATQIDAKLGRLWAAESDVLAELGAASLETHVRLQTAATVARERFVASRLAEVVTLPREDREPELEEDAEAQTTLVLDQTEVVLVDRLTALDPECVSLWEGASAALSAGGPDVARHVGASLRELFRYVLHTLSPDDKVQDWSTDPKDFSNGKPTRKARIRFIARQETASMQKYVATDVDAVGPFLKLFDESVHRVPSELTAEEARVLHVRMAALLLTVLPEA